MGVLQDARGKRPFKLWDGQRSVRKGLVVGSLEELVARGRDKLGVTAQEPKLSESPKQIKTPDASKSNGFCAMSLNLKFLSAGSCKLGTVLDRQAYSLHTKVSDVEGDGRGGGRLSEHESSESETENTVMEDEAVTSEKFLLLIDQLSVDQKRHLSIKDIGIILERLSSKILDVERLDRESESDDCYNWTIKAERAALWLSGRLDLSSFVRRPGPKASPSGSIYCTANVATVFEGRALLPAKICDFFLGRVRQRRPLAVKRQHLELFGFSTKLNHV
ncbi:hypothetical protein HUJ05_010965 [Dendroctonus ponderosae]|nr:hypothetical protein HUJ05_010965 [Dendroctonus ponderosae]